MAGALFSPCEVPELPGSIAPVPALTALLLLLSIRVPVVLTVMPDAPSETETLETVPSPWTVMP